MKIIYEGLLSLYSFLNIIILSVFLIITSKIVFSAYPIWLICIVSILFAYLLVNVVYCISGRKGYLSVSIRASFLGAVFSTGLCVSYLGDRNLSIFGWYMCVLSFFHYSEYLAIAVTNPKTLTTDAFMLNHSLAYKTAACVSWLEFFLEYYFYRDLKDHYYISIIGLLLCICGEIVRKLSMITASTNFNHIVQTVKHRDHILITHGIYGLCRHPSYVGWFYWSIGTQIVLVNPICIVVYAVASWTFFNGRIIVEEESLINFFGEEYINYKSKVPSGLPFIKGISLD
ncbi:protein-S-isoprenylcysteine O-methyltransferase [Planococcus citri]|uniref:protein-S-isoprenylcysteine O-methyltransferase n=1 Tax=Planococcus citri TaxID=170843 RepID=UPI0031F857A7